MWFMQEVIEWDCINTHTSFPRFHCSKVTFTTIRWGDKWEIVICFLFPDLFISLHRLQVWYYPYLYLHKMVDALPLDCRLHLKNNKWLFVPFVLLLSYLPSFLPSLHLSSISLPVLEVNSGDNVFFIIWLILTCFIFSFHLVVLMGMLLFYMWFMIWL